MLARQTSSALCRPTERKFQTQLYWERSWRRCVPRNL